MHIILLSWLIGAINLSPANAGPCDCPAKDPLRNDKCGPMPPGVKKAQSAEYSPSTCKSTKPPSWFEKVFHADELAQQVKTTVIPKTDDEILDYISCYRKSDKTFCHYKDTVLPLLKQVSEASRIPTGVYSCLMFRESQFSPKAKSEVGAVGYGQLMPGAISDLKEIVSLDQNGYRESMLRKLRIPANKSKRGDQESLEQVLTVAIDKFESAIEEKWKSKNSNIFLFANVARDLRRDLTKVKKMHGPYTTKRIEEIYQAQVAIAAHIIKQYQLFRTMFSTNKGSFSGWMDKSFATNVGYLVENYQTMKTRKNARKIWDRYYAGIKAPNKINSAWATCPQVAVAMSAVKLSYDLGLLYPKSMDHLDTGGPLEISIEGNTVPSSDAGVLLGGIYNMGVGNYATYCRGQKDLQECMENLSARKNKAEQKSQKKTAKAIDETLGQMNSIRNCLHKGSSEPPVGTAQQDCKGKGCSQ